MGQTTQAQDDDFLPDDEPVPVMQRLELDSPL